MLLYVVRNCCIHVIHFLLSHFIYLRIIFCDLDVLKRLYYKTVNVLMWISGEKSDAAWAAGITATGLPWYLEMLTVIALLLVACKKLKS